MDPDPPVPIDIGLDYLQRSNYSGQAEEIQGNSFDQLLLSCLPPNPIQSGLPGCLVAFSPRLLDILLPVWTDSQIPYRYLANLDQCRAHFKHQT